ncbi:MAG: DUF5011 domain-containing protein, partial [Bacilli bacterium]
MNIFKKPIAKTTKQIASGLTVIAMSFLAFVAGTDVYQNTISKKPFQAAAMYMEAKGISLTKDEELALPYQLLATSYPSYYKNVDASCMTRSYIKITGNKMEKVEMCGNSTEPRIELNGSSSITIEVGNTYVEEGAVILGDYNLDIIVSGHVDTSKTGTYLLNYITSDNTITPKVRVVEVVDTTAPSLTLNGSTVVYLNKGTNYNELSGVATDNYDKNILVKVVTNNVNSNVTGEYKVTYEAVDSHNNKTEATRTVIVLENIPVIKLAGPASINLNYLETYQEAGFKATDEKGIDITNQVVVVNNVNTAVLGTYNISYTVTRSDGLKIEVIREVRVIDNTAPSLKLNGDSQVTIRFNKDTYQELGALASDNYDHILTNKIVKTGFLDEKKIGTYYLTYQVSDSSHNKTTITRIVKVIDDEAPVIKLNAGNSIELNINNDFIDPSYTALDNYDQDITNKVQVNRSNLNMHVPGDYAVTYSVKDTSNNETTTTRLVRVNDLEAPVIKLNGPTTTYVELGKVFNDRGANVTDNLDAPKEIKGVFYNSQGQVVTEIKELGTYTVNYDTTDKAGNKALTVVRTVIVRDQSKPLVSLSSNSVKKFSQSVSVDVLAADLNGALKTVQYAWTTTDATPQTNQFIIFNNYNIDTNHFLNLNNVSGTYYLHVVATDVNGNTSIPRAIGPFYLDNEAPSVSYSPNGSVGNQIKTTLNITDLGSGIKEQLCAFSNNNTTSPTDYAPCNNGEITKPGYGSYYLWVKTTDIVGNSKEVVSNLFIAEKAKPSITFDNQGLYVNKALSKVTMTAYDGKTISKIEYAWVKLGNPVKYTTYTGPISSLIEFSQDNINGDYELWVKVTDNENAISSMTSPVFHVDSTKPVINIKEVVTPSKSVTVLVDVSDENIQNIYKIVSTKASVTDSDFTNATLWTDYKTNPKIEIKDVTGEYYIHILASDKVGNKSLVSSNKLIIDNTKPEKATITPSQDLTTWINKPLVITLSSLEGQVYYRINNQNWIYYEQPVVINSSNTLLETRVMDNAGNYSDISSINPLKIDLDKATINLNYSSALSKILNVKYDVNDTLSKISTIRYAITTTEVEPTTWENILNVKDKSNVRDTITVVKPSGLYYLYLEVVDNAGNRTVANTKALAIDNAQPVVNIESLKDLNPQTSFDLLVNITDDNLKTVEYALTTSNAEPTTYTTWYSYSNINNHLQFGSEYQTGQYYLHLKVTDKVGNETKVTASDIYKLVREDAQIDITPNGQATYKKDASTDINVTLPSFVTPTSMEYIWLEENADVNASTNIWTTFTTSIRTTKNNVSGNYYLYVRVIDNVNGGRTKLVKSNVYKLDNTLPTLTLSVDGTNGIFVEKAETIITALDNLSGVKTVEYAFVSKDSIEPFTYKEVVNNTAVITPNVTELKGYYLKVKVTDNANNIYQYTSNLFFIDIDLPVVNILNPNKQIPQKDLNIEVKIEAINNKKIRNVYYAWTKTNTPLAGDSKEWILDQDYNLVNCDTHYQILADQLSGEYYLQVKAVDSNNSIKQVVSDKMILDKDKPVITLVGTDLVTVKAFSTYTDAGATANDIIDGDLTSKITVVSNVNTSNVGTYTVTYTVVDLAGNPATLTRTIVVEKAMPTYTVPTNLTTVYGKT